MDLLVAFVIVFAVVGLFGLGLAWLTKLLLERDEGEDA